MRCKCVTFDSSVGRAETVVVGILDILRLAGSNPARRIIFDQSILLSF